MQPGVTSRKCLQPQAIQLRKGMGRDYKKPGIGARILAVFFRLLPKVGPFKAAAFKAPTQKTERLFMDSFQSHTGAIPEITSPIVVRSGLQCRTGTLTRAN